MIAYGGQLIIDDNTGKLTIYNFVDNYAMTATVPAEVTRQIPPQLAMLAKALNGTYGPIPEDA